MGFAYFACYFFNVQVHFQIFFSTIGKFNIRPSYLQGSLEGLNQVAYSQPYTLIATSALF